VAGHTKREKETLSKIKREREKEINSVHEKPCLYQEEISISITNITTNFIDILPIKKVALTLCIRCTNII
jgi:hypothetical protein